MDPKAIAQEFVKHYYNTFDTNRQCLKGLYMNESCLAFEGQEFVGAEQIGAKLESLPFQAVKHIITTVDVQIAGSFMLIAVLGQLKTDDDPPHSFFQTFVLTQTPAGSLMVLNDIFRLAIHSV